MKKGKGQKLINIYRSPESKRGQYINVCLSLNVESAFWLEKCLVGRYYLSLDLKVEDVDKPLFPMKNEIHLLKLMARGPVDFAYFLASG